MEWVDIINFLIYLKVKLGHQKLEETYLYSGLRENIQYLLIMNTFNICCFIIKTTAKPLGNKRNQT